MYKPTKLLINTKPLIGPNSRRLTIFKSMVYLNLYHVTARSRYWTSVIGRVGSCLFRAYFSQQI